MNVYEALGFGDPACEQHKSDLVAAMSDQIDRLGLSHDVVAAHLGLSERKLSKLLRGRTGAFSVGRLMRFARALGGETMITIRFHH